MSTQRKIERLPVKPVPLTASSLPTQEELDDEMFEMELVGQYAAFVAGTPFVLPPDDEDEEDENDA